MQAIECKYIGPTNTRGSRIKATCAAGSITIGYPHELSGQAVYRAAAEALMEKLNWNEHWYARGKEGKPRLIGGCLPNGNYCFVLDNEWGDE